MKTMKMATLAVAVMAASSFSQFAAAEVSANFGATSNYLWRGVSQSSDGVSVSGGVDYSDESGFYAGTWIGSIDFGSGNGTENDYYLGYSGESDGFGYDVGYIYYVYPADGFEDSNFGEIYFNGSFGGFGFGVAYTINSDVDNDAPFGTGDIYYSASYGFDLPEEFGLGLTVGYYDFDTKDSADMTYDVDYMHYQVDLTKGDFTFTISKAEEASGSNDTKFAVSWGTSF